MRADPQSLRSHLLEEAYEVYDALEAGATPELADELGDLWLQIVLHAQLAAEARVFDLADVQAAISTKIVRRHPHVFGNAGVRTASDVNRQWERIKAAEREGEADEAATKGALDGISTAAGLAASQEMQERAANIGYDWPSIDGVLDKVIEETEELREAAETGDDPAAWAEEFGDLLFVLVNVARKRGIEAEAAVRAANASSAAVRPGRGDGRRAWCRCATWTSCARRAVGRRQGGGENMTIGNRPPSSVPTVARPVLCVRSASSSASRSGPRGRASSGSATRRSCARRRSPTASRPISAARAAAG